MIVVGDALRVTVPWPIRMVVVLERPCQVAVMVAVPVVGPGLRVVVALPSASVAVCEGVRVPRSVEKATGVLMIAVPLIRMVAFIVEVMVEFVAIVVGEAEKVMVPSAMVTFTDEAMLCQTAVMLAVSWIVSG